METVFKIYSDSRDFCGWGNEKDEVEITNPKDILPLIQNYLNKVANQETVNAINFAIEIKKGDEEWTYQRPDHTRA